MASESLVSLLTAVQETVHKVTSKVAELGVSREAFPRKASLTQQVGSCMHPSSSLSPTGLPRGCQPWEAGAEGKQFQLVRM